MAATACTTTTTTLCNTGSFTPGPTVGTYPPASAGHLYLWVEDAAPPNDNSFSFGVLEFPEPLASGTPAYETNVTDGGGFYGSLAVDVSGRLFEGVSPTSVYALPLTSSSAPLFSIAGSFAPAGFDSSGDLISTSLGPGLWVADA
jgi:hypothetical protein